MHIILLPEVKDKNITDEELAKRINIKNVIVLIKGPYNEEVILGIVIDVWIDDRIAICLAKIIICIG